MKITWIEEREQLLDRIAELEGLLGMREVIPIKGLSPTAAVLLGVLLKREFISWSSARTLMSWDATDENYVKVYVWKLRQWLGAERNLIQTRHSEGIWIAAKDKPRVREIIAERRI